MKTDNKYRTLLLLALSLFPLYIIHSQWISQNSGTTKVLRDIVFTDSLHGWAVGDSGTVLKTSNAGSSWQSDSSFTHDIEFREIGFFNVDSGYIGGNLVIKHPFFQTRRAILYKTTNGGLKWTQCLDIVDTNASFRDFCFTDASTGYLCTNNIGNISASDRKGTMYKTTNGGGSWEIIKSRPGYMIGSMEIINNGTGYAFWSLGFDNFDDTDVDATNDGGATWRTAGKILLDNINKVLIINRDSLWTIGQSLSFSGDAGRTWTSWNMSNPIVAGQKRFYASDIEIKNYNHIVLFGAALSSPSDLEGRIVESIDHGKQWNILYQLGGGSFNAAYLLKDMQWWVAGKDGLIMKSNSTPLEVAHDKATILTQCVLQQNYPNPFNPSTTIEYEIPQGGEIVLSVHDILGRTIASQRVEQPGAGRYRYSFNASHLSSGIYFYRISFDGSKQTKRMVLLK